MAKIYLYVHNEYVQQWRRNINNTVVNSTLRTYCTFKDSFTIDPYLLHICDFKLGRVITFRLSCHNLEVEKGRYRGLARWCSSVCFDSTYIETERHFLMDCTFYTEMRTTTYTNIGKYNGLITLKKKLNCDITCFYFVKKC